MKDPRGEAPGSSKSVVESSGAPTGLFAPDKSVWRPSLVKGGAAKPPRGRPGPVRHRLPAPFRGPVHCLKELGRRVGPELRVGAQGPVENLPQLLADIVPAPLGAGQLIGGLAGEDLLRGPPGERRGAQQGVVRYRRQAVEIRPLVYPLPEELLRARELGRPALTGGATEL